MNDRHESPVERKKRLARERKQKQRERQKAHLESVGAKDVTLTLYQGTQDALERLKEFNQCEEWQEVTTLLIHNAASLIERDPSQLKKLLKT